MFEIRKIRFCFSTSLTKQVHQTIKPAKIVDLRGLKLGKWLFTLQHNSQNHQIANIINLIDLKLEKWLFTFQLNEPNKILQTIKLVY